MKYAPNLFVKYLMVWNDPGHIQ